MAGLLYAQDIRINDAIQIYIPSVGEVLENENTYFEVVSSIIATPYDMMVQLDDAGIDFTKINDFELFCIMLDGLKKTDTSLVIKGIELGNFDPALDPNSNEMVLVDVKNNIVIDRAVHASMCSAICKIMMIERQHKKPANDEAKSYLISKARRKLKRKQAQKRDYTELEDLIIGLVNTAEFKYDYTTVKYMSLLQFYASLKQISHKIKFDNTMIGYYAGTVKYEDLSLADRTWLRL